MYVYIRYRTQARCTNLCVVKTHSSYNLKKNNHSDIQTYTHTQCASNNLLYKWPVPPPTNIHAYIHTHTHTHTHTNTHIHTHTHTLRNTSPRPSIAHMPVPPPTDIHAYIQTHVHISQAVYRTHACTSPNKREADSAKSRLAQISHFCSREQRLCREEDAQGNPVGVWHRDGSKV
jgi:hypothetical protein